MLEMLTYLRELPPLLFILGFVWVAIISIYAATLYDKVAAFTFSKNAYNKFVNSFNKNVNTVKDELSDHKKLSARHRSGMDRDLKTTLTLLNILSDKVKIQETEIIQLKEHQVTNGLAVGARLTSLENPITIDKKTKKKLDPTATKKKRKYKKRVSTKRGPYKTKKKVTKKKVTKKKVTKKVTK